VSSFALLFVFLVSFQLESEETMVICLRFAAHAVAYKGALELQVRVFVLGDPGMPPTQYNILSLLLLLDVRGEFQAGLGHLRALAAFCLLPNL
jgi:hypothetical protein